MSRIEANVNTGKVTTHPDAASSHIPETPAQAEAKKDAQVESEFTPALLAIVNELDPVNAGTLIAQAKANRKAEL